MADSNGWTFTPPAAPVLRGAQDAPAPLPAPAQAAPDAGWTFTPPPAAATPQVTDGRSWQEAPEYDGTFGGMLGSLFRRGQVNYKDAGITNNAGVAVTQPISQLLTNAAGYDGQQSNEILNQRTRANQAEYEAMRPWVENPNFLPDLKGNPGALLEFLSAAGGTTLGALTNPTAAIGGGAKTLLGKFGLGATGNAVGDAIGQIGNLFQGNDQVYDPKSEVYDPATQSFVPTQDAEGNDNAPYKSKGYDVGQTTGAALFGGVLNSAPDAAGAAVKTLSELPAKIRAWVNTERVKTAKPGAPPPAADAPPSAEETHAALASPEIKVILDANGIDPNHPRYKELADAVGAKVSANAARVAETPTTPQGSGSTNPRKAAAEVTKEVLDKRDLKEGVASGDISSAYLQTPLRPSIPDVLPMGQSREIPSGRVTSIQDAPNAATDPGLVASMKAAGVTDLDRAQRSELLDKFGYVPESAEQRTALYRRMQAEKDKNQTSLGVLQQGEAGANGGTRAQSRPFDEQSTAIAESMKSTGNADITDAQKAELKAEYGEVPPTVEARKALYGALDTRRKAQAEADAKGQLNTSDEALSNPDGGLYEPASKPIPEGVAAGKREGAGSAENSAASRAPTDAEVARYSQMTPQEVAKLPAEERGMAHRVRNGYARSSSGVGDRPYRGDSAAPKFDEVAAFTRMRDLYEKMQSHPEGSAEAAAAKTAYFNEMQRNAEARANVAADAKMRGKFEEDARAKAEAEKQAAIDDLINTWKQRERARTENGGERDQYRERTQRAEETYSGNTRFSNEPKGFDSDGRWHVDENGFVLSKNGNPIKFKDHVQAARWILKAQKESPDQNFELHNYPGGTGLTVWERSRTSKRSGAGADTGADAGGSRSGPGGDQAGARNAGDETDARAREYNESHGKERLGLPKPEPKAADGKSGKAAGGKGKGGKKAQGEPKPDAKAAETVQPAEQPKPDVKPEAAAAEAPKAEEPTPKAAEEPAQKFDDAPPKTEVPKGVPREEPKPGTSTEELAKLKKEHAAVDAETKRIAELGREAQATLDKHLATKASLEGKKKKTPLEKEKLKFASGRIGVLQDDIKMLHTKFLEKKEERAKLRKAIDDGEAEATLRGQREAAAYKEQLNQKTGLTPEEKKHFEERFTEDGADREGTPVGAEEEPQTREDGSPIDEPPFEDDPKQQILDNPLRPREDGVEVEDRTPNAVWIGDKVIRYANEEQKLDGETVNTLHLELDHNQSGDITKPSTRISDMPEEFSQFVGAAEQDPRISVITVYAHLDHKPSMDLLTKLGFERNGKPMGAKTGMMVKFLDRFAKDEGGGVKMYGGIPFLDPELWGPALKAELKGIKAGIDELRAAFKGSTSLGGTVKAVIGGAADVGRVAVSSIRGNLFTIRNRYKGNDVAHKILTEITDHLADDPGSSRVVKTILEEAIRDKTNSYNSRIVNILKSIDKKDLEALGTAMAQGKAFDPTVQGRVRKVLNDIHADVSAALEEAAKDRLARAKTPAEKAEAKAALEEATLGYSKNYFPRQLDETRIAADSEGFIADATKEYQRLGLSREDAKQAATEWMMRELGLGKTAFGSTLVPSSVKGRVLPPSADIRLNKWYERNPAIALPAYVHRMVSFAENTRRFGLNGEKLDSQLAKLKEAGVSEHDLSFMRLNVDSALGMFHRDTNSALNSAVSVIQTAGMLRTLPRVLWSSISEPIAYAARTGRARDGLIAFGNTIRQVFDSGSMQDKRDIAEIIGVINNANHLHLIQNFGAVAPTRKNQVGRVTSYVQSKFLERTGLVALTDYQRISGVPIMQEMINRLVRDHADPAKTKSAAHILGELGLDAKDIGDIRSLLAGKNGSIRAADIIESPAGKKYGSAVARGIMNTIQESKRVDKAVYANHPYIGLVYGITGFQRAFTRNLMYRQMKLLGHAASGVMKGDLSAAEASRMAIAPGIGLLTLLSVQYGMAKMRDQITNPTEAAQRPKELSNLQYLSRTGIFMNMDPYINAGLSLKYNRDLSQMMAGPYAVGYLQDLQKMVALAPPPYGSNSPNSNTAEWNADRALYTSIISPTVALGLSVAPGGPILTKAYGLLLNSPFGRSNPALAPTSPEAAGAFATGLAGERPKRWNYSGQGSGSSGRGRGDSDRSGARGRTSDATPVGQAAPVQTAQNVVSKSGKSYTIRKKDNGDMEVIAHG